MGGRGSTGGRGGVSPPGDDERRPRARDGVDVESWQLKSSLRAEAALRLPPLPHRPGSDLAARDPLLPWPPRQRQPSTYGLTADELAEHRRRLLRESWALWEVQAVLADPREALA